MLNKGVLALNVPLPGARRFMLTKTLEWNLRWGILDHMFDEATFCIRPEFVSHPELLEQRLRCPPFRLKTEGVCSAGKECLKLPLCCSVFSPGQHDVQIPPFHSEVARRRSG
jgi:Autophagy protein ATG9